MSYMFLLYSNFDDLLPSLDASSQCAILHAKDGNLSSWLAVLPVHRDHAV